LVSLFFNFSRVQKVLNSIIKESKQGFFHQVG